MQDNEFQPCIQHLVRLSARCEGRKKAWAEMQDFKYPLLKKVLEDVLHQNAE